MCTAKRPLGTGLRITGFYRNVDPETSYFTAIACSNPQNHDT